MLFAVLSNQVNPYMCM